MTNKNYARKFFCSHWTRWSSIQWLSVLLTWHFCNGLLQHELPHYSQQDMPVTSFSCLDKTVGIYYADHETQCQMFHICVKVPGLGLQDFKFLCPNYTLFDQESQICDDWYNIDCEASYSYHNENFDLYRIGVVRDDKQSTANPQTKLLSGPASEFRRTTSKKIAASYNENNNYIDSETLKGSDSSNFFENNIEKQRYANSKDDFNDYKKVTNANEKNYAPATDRSKSKLRQPSKLIINKQLINNGNDYEPANNNQFHSQQRETSTAAAKTDYPSTPFKNNQQNPSNDLSQFKNQRNNPAISEHSPSKLKNYQANPSNNDQIPSQLKNHQANSLNNDQTPPQLRNQVSANDDFPTSQYRNQANSPGPQHQHQHQQQQQQRQHQHQHHHHQRKYSTESRLPTTVVADNTIFGESTGNEDNYSDKYSATGNLAQSTTYSGEEQSRRNPGRIGATSNTAPFQQQTSTYYVPASTPSPFVTGKINDNGNNKQWTGQESGQKWEQPLSTFAFTDEHNSNPYIIKATTVSNEFPPSSIDDRYNGDVVNLNNRQSQQRIPQKLPPKDNNGNAVFSGEILKTAQSTNIKSANINKIVPDLYFSTSSTVPSSLLNTTSKSYLHFDGTPSGKSAPAAAGKLSYQVGSDLIIKVLSGTNVKSEAGKSPPEQNQKPPTKQKNDYDYAYYDDSPNDYELTEKSVNQDFGRISGVIS